MRATQLISPAIPTLSPSDSGTKALYLMEELHIVQIPMVEDGRYITLVREEILLNWETPHLPLSQCTAPHFRPAVNGEVHAYEVLRISHKEHLSIVPVVDDEDHYLGAISRDDLLRFFTEKSGLDNPGAIIVLSIEPRSYSLTEIARICENEDITILNSQLNTHPETGVMEVMLKLNKTELGAVISSFERHGYTIQDVYGNVQDDEELSSRYDLLMNYINM